MIYPFGKIEGISQKSYAAFRLFGFSNFVPSYEGTNEGSNDLFDVVLSLFKQRVFLYLFIALLLHFLYCPLLAIIFSKMVFERTNVPNERMYEAMIY